MSIKIFVKTKSIGKRKPPMENIPYTLSEQVNTLRQLIQALVRQEVSTYNKKGLENMLIPFLTEDQIKNQETAGKVGFGRLYSDKKADPDRAIEVAIQGFEDGLFKVLLEEKELTELDAPIHIHEGANLTFIRLTFLAGRMW